MWSIMPSGWFTLDTILVLFGLRRSRETPAVQLSATGRQCSPYIQRDQSSEQTHIKVYECLLRCLYKSAALGLDVSVVPAEHLWGWSISCVVREDWCSLSLAGGSEKKPLNELRHWLGGSPQWLTFSLCNDHIWFPRLHKPRSTHRMTSDGLCFFCVVLINE